jgi:hypothetical protein
MAEGRESLYRTGLTKALYEKVEKQDDEGQELARDTLDAINDVQVDTSGGDTRWLKRGDEREW